MTYISKHDTLEITSVFSVSMATMFYYLSTWIPMTTTAIVTIAITLLSVISIATIKQSP